MRCAKEAWRLAPAGVLCLALAAGAAQPLEERFRAPPAGEGLCLTLRVGAGGAGPEEAAGAAARLRELGAGGVLAVLGVADEAGWASLVRLGEACRKTGLELGVRDFFVSPEERASAPLARRVTAAERPAGAAGGSNEFARLAVPAGGPVLPHQVAVLRGSQPAPTGGPWRILAFERVPLDPPAVDVLDEPAVSRHVNGLLSELQSRLGSGYGTTLSWYQGASFGAGAWPWPRDIEALFLKRTGLGLARHLPSLAGVPVGGEASAAHVRREVAAAARDAWRGRYAANVRDWVQEAGLEAAFAVGEAPVAPEEAALYFRRPVFDAAHGAEARDLNVRAAGAARASGRRVMLGRLRLAEAVAAAASALLPFPNKPALDALYADGATRVLLEAENGEWLDAAAGRGAALQAACAYARRCQALLRHGEPASDCVLWSDGLASAPAWLACDFTCRAALETATVKDGLLRFPSERAYPALVVASAVLADPGAERLVRQYSDRGVAVWELAGGDAGQTCARLVRIFARGGEAERPPPAAGWRVAGAADGPRVRALQRRSPEAEIYFVVNDSAASGPASLAFRDIGRGVPERWDPADGSASVLEERRSLPGGWLEASLYLGPYDACFIVFAR